MLVLDNTGAATIRPTYRAVAVVDWIRLVVNTQSPTQFQWLQRDLAAIMNLPTDKRIHVKARHPGSGGVSTCFAITFHDGPANNVHELCRIMDELAKRFPLSGQPVVDGIEVALDFYKKGAPGDLLSMTRQLQGCIAAYDGNARLHFPDTGQSITLGSGVRLDPAKTMRIGHESDDLQWRVYLKTTDNVKDAKAQRLPIELHRARAEVTLSHAALAQHAHADCFGMDHLYKLGFQTLAKHLHFRRFKDLDVLAAGSERRLSFYRAHSSLFECVARGLGRAKTRKVDPVTGQVRYARARKHSRWTEAHTELNHIVRDKLSDLTRKFAEIGMKKEASPGL